MLTKQITDLKTKIIESATLVESMIEKSIKGLSEKNTDIFFEVIKKDEPKVNHYDREIDEACTTFIAQYEPVARDLRMVLMILKMNNDLERMGDHAVNISESGLFLVTRPVLKPSANISVMGQTAISMLKESIQSFVYEDPQLARTVCERDSIVDNLGDMILDEITSFLREEHDGVKRSLHLMRIAHNIERIGDLSTNICEEVIYIVEGKVIKHQSTEEAGPKDI